MKVFLFLVVVLALAVAVSAQCTDFPNNLDSYACKLGDHGPVFVDGGVAACEEVNSNPFATMTETCYNLMLQDKNCKYAVGNYFCSARCPECSTILKLPCENICADIVDRCPTMWANVNCRNLNRCVADANCSNIDVNEGKIDKITGGSDGSDSGSASQGAGVNMLITAVVGLAAGALYLN